MKLRQNDSANHNQHQNQNGNDLKIKQNVNAINNSNHWQCTQNRGNHSIQRPQHEVNPAISSTTTPMQYNQTQNAFKFGTENALQNLMRPQSVQNVLTTQPQTTRNQFLPMAPSTMTTTRCGVAGRGHVGGGSMRQTAMIPTAAGVGGAVGNSQHIPHDATSNNERSQNIRFPSFGTVQSVEGTRFGHVEFPGFYS